jgi:uroporphyrinogen decarboxylase
VLAALRGEEPDRVPCALGFFSQGLFGADDADEYFGTDVRFVDFAAPSGQDTFLAYLESLPPGVHVGSVPQLRTYHEWGYRPGHPTEDGERIAADARTASHHIVERVAGLLPGVIDRRRHAHLKSDTERLHAEGWAVAGSPPHLGGELFESAWRLRGFEPFMKDLVRRPDVADYLLDQLLAMATESARILAAADVDILVLDDDVASQRGLLISPAMWRSFFKPRLAQIIATARQTSPGLAVLYHCDGDFTALLDDLVEIGANAVNPVAPDCMDAVAIRRRFGTSLALWGTIGSARAWDCGSADEIRREVRARIESLGRRSLLLCPSYDLDFSPRENVEAFVAAAREFG